MSLEIKKNFNSEKEHWYVELSGEIDVYTAGQLKDIFTKMIEEKKENIKINTENLEYIDSTGLGVLIGILKKLKEKDKNIILTNIKSNVKKLLNITGLDKIFIIEE